MNTVKMKGKNVEEAIKGALEVLKIDRDSATIRVIDEGEPAKLGVFGGRDAEVEVGVKMELAEKARSILQEMLDRMGFIAQVYVGNDTADSVTLDIKADDVSRIIGRDGHTIDSIEYLTSILANRGMETRKRVTVDADGYRTKQTKRIERIAKDTAEEVKVSGRGVTLPPMTAKERRIVHMTIKEMKGVASGSIGMGSDRSVVITPQK